MTSEKKTRRRYSATKRSQVLAECAEPGASVAQVALAHGINANVVHRWRQLSRNGAGPGEGLAMTSEFIALPLPAPTVPAAAPCDVRVELKRGAVSITVTWPLSAAAELAAWTRELLR
jgi:transposase